MLEMFVLRRFLLLGLAFLGESGEAGVQLFVSIWEGIFRNSFAGGAKGKG